MKWFFNTASHMAVTYSHTCRAQRQSTRIDVQPHKRSHPHSDRQIGRCITGVSPQTHKHTDPANHSLSLVYSRPLQLRSSPPHHSLDSCIPALFYVHEQLRLSALQRQHSYRNTEQCWLRSWKWMGKLIMLRLRESKRTNTLSISIKRWTFVVF